MRTPAAVARFRYNLLIIQRHVTRYASDVRLQNLPLPASCFIQTSTLLERLTNHYLSANHY